MLRDALRLGRLSRAGCGRGERGAAVVDFVLVLVVLVPLFLGLLQVGLVLHVRNTLTAAASEGARLRRDRRPPAGGTALSARAPDPRRPGRPFRRARSPLGTCGRRRPGRSR